jgi:pimeloyl-ACP methyl ester carboxylesterase
MGSVSKFFLLMFLLIFWVFFLEKTVAFAQTYPTKPTIYLLPGQGADGRLFGKWHLDTAYTTRHIVYPTPQKNETMPHFAQKLVCQIDTTQPYILIGTSLGGMLCVELADVLNPKKIIIISSAKCRNELPANYRFQRYVPLNKIVPKKIVKHAALLLQPIVEPDRNTQKATFVSMLQSKDPTYMKRSVNMIINWQRTTYNPKIVHIHGTDDHTLPYKNIKKVDITLLNGSHMMTLTQADTITYIINKILSE